MKISRKVFCIVFVRVWFLLHQAQNSKEYACERTYDGMKITSTQKFHTLKLKVPTDIDINNNTNKNDNSTKKTTEQRKREVEREKTQFILKYYIKKLFILV